MKEKPKRFVNIDDASDLIGTVGAVSFMFGVLVGVILAAIFGTYF